MTYRATEERYCEDMFGHRYTNGILPASSPVTSVALNGRYKTLKATAVVRYDSNGGSPSGASSTYDCTFWVDGNEVAVIKLSQASGPRTIEIPLNYGMNLEIRGGGFSLANAILE